MLSISQLPSFSLTSVKSLRYPSSSSSSLSVFFSFFPKVSNFVRASSGIPNLVACSPKESIIPRVNNAGLRIEETVDGVKGKIRLDSWISSRVNGVSRARVQSSIRLGLVTVNGRVVDKVLTSDSVLQFFFVNFLSFSTKFQSLPGFTQCKSWR